MNQERLETRTVIVLILVAYLFSLAVRMIWVYQFQDNPNFYWNGQIMINTNDGYFFASGAQKALYGMHMENPRIPSVWSYGTVALTVLLAKITPFSLETITLYLPAIISSLVVIPIILIGRLFGMTLWGFFSALLAAVIWSYYNRTMVGYYDTDMFSAMAPMFILYFLMKSTMDVTLRSALYAAIAIALYPFFYDSGASIVNAMGIIYALYMLYYHRHEKMAYASIILVFLALVPIGIPTPYSYILKVIILIVVYFVLQKVEWSQKHLLIVAGILFLAFMYFGNVFGLILSKITYYTSTGTKIEGLHFYSVTQTIREASKVLFFPLPEGMPYRANIAHRMMGSSIGLIMALLGYILLVIRYRVFLLALPLIGIGIFAHWGGLRFTVYAVPIAAMSALYLVYEIIQAVSKKKSIYLLGMTAATALLLYPNITHIIGYKVPTVLNASEVADLDKLNKHSEGKDYTLAWWDYGYPIWYYADTSTLIDGGKHNNDNFIISKIMQTTSPKLAASLGRLAVETYAQGVDSVRDYRQQKDPSSIPEKFKMTNAKGETYHAGGGAASDVIFRNGQKDQVTPICCLPSLRRAQ